MKDFGLTTIGILTALALTPSAPVAKSHGEPFQLTETRLADSVPTGKRIVLHGAECESDDDEGLCPEVRALLDEALSTLGTDRHPTALRLETAGTSTPPDLEVVREYLVANGVAPERTCSAPVGSSVSPRAERQQIVLSISADADSPTADLACASRARSGR